MSVVETTTFQLTPGVDDAAFLVDDTRVQKELVPNQPGFLRRTTAHDPDTHAWLVVTLWATRADAEVFDMVAATHPVQAEFLRHIDRATLHSARFDTLG